MLTRVVIFPCVFNSVADAQVIILLLKDLMKSGVILIEDRTVDNQSEVFQSIRTKIDCWHPKFKPKAKEFLKKLQKKNRFVGALLDQPLSQTCINQTEENCIKIFTSEDFYSVIAGKAQCVELGKNITLIEDYSISPLAGKLNRSSLTLKVGEWKQDRFEQEILIPIFRNAKHIKIYDRWIGRSVSQGQTNHQMTLEWLLEVFQRSAKIRTDTTFEVCCGIDTRTRPNQPTIDIPKAVTSLRQFETSLSSRYSYFNLIIKHEEHSNELPHDRYLFTEQAAIYIGRGFDLFVDRSEAYPRRIRDIEIGFCSEPEKIIQAANRLTSL
jgi:hypothetical protein